MQFSVDVHIIDSFASHDEVMHEYGLTVRETPDSDYDAVIVAVGHDDYKTLTMSDFKAMMGKDPILMDLKSMYENNDDSLTYWRL
jgi:UDP-N-acetyl-D-galactosamine dehydrogenase